MRSSYGGGRVCVMTTLLVLLFGRLSPCIQGRSTLLNNGGDDETNKSYPRNSHLTSQPPCPSSSTANSTSPVDESKIKLVMCVYKGLNCVESEPCFCCALEQPAPRCYCTHSECEAKCPFCYPPPCSPGAAVEEGRAVREQGAAAIMLPCSDGNRTTGGCLNCV
ncbi:hypothetical protein PAHAL_1G050400 [Panicum hallii]|uniref:Bowman-Birk serine protease inhibitors family domain-containing protein n=1 Tax=Panicum hallii TaxID=206008 RepID=A0A2S3GM04_9POAL|nr:hypothetical protein PAHAL_1G050400 [Panicum hallii]